MARDPSYERRLHRWVNRNSYRWQRGSWDRPEANGRTRYWWMGPFEPAAEPVLFVHGTGNNGLYPQVHIFQTLIAAGHEVVAFDLDGHGHDSNTVFDRHIIPGVVPWAVHQAEVMLQRPVRHVIGHSLGGVLALQGAATGMLPQVRSMTVYCSPMQLEFERAWHLWREAVSFMAPSYHLYSKLYKLYDLVPAFGQFKRSKFPLRLSADAQQGSGNYVNEIGVLFEELDILSQATQIRQPCLCLYADLDVVAPRHQGRELARRLPKGQYSEVSLSTHLTMPFQPETLIETLRWVKAHDQASPS